VAVTAQRVTVTASPTALNAIGSSGLTLTIKNGATAIDLGPSSVTSGAGYSLAASGTVVVEVEGGDVLYGITASGSSNVEALRT
jgi:hypothetical protein